MARCTAIIYFLLTSACPFINSLSLQLQNTSTPDQLRNPTFKSSHCIDNVDWTAAKCNIKHCVAALQQIWMREKLRGGVQYEFCGSTQHSRTNLWRAAVPQTFVAGTLSSNPFLSFCTSVCVYGSDIRNSSPEKKDHVPSCCTI